MLWRRYRGRVVGSGAPRRVGTTGLAALCSLVSSVSTLQKSSVPILMGPRARGADVLLRLVGEGNIISLPAGKESARGLVRLTVADAVGALRDEEADEEAASARVR